MVDLRRAAPPLLLLLALALTGLARAIELPPYVYKEWQQKAPESLIIKVRSVKTSEEDEPRRKKISVTVLAQVQKVERSKAGLKPGQMITITYVHSRYQQPLAGPSEVPILEEGKVYPAFLKKAEGEDSYSPAAGGRSFEVVK